MMHDYVVMKLVNAETIICVMVTEDDESFTIMYPVQMKPTRMEVAKEGKEFQVGVPWVPYSDEKVFTIYKQDVVLLQRLNESTIAYYKNLVDMSEIKEEELHIKDDSTTIVEFDYDQIFVKGNNTIH